MRRFSLGSAFNAFGPVARGGEFLVYLMVAYSVFWAFTFALVVSMWSRQNQVARDIEMLRAQLDTRERHAGDSGTAV